MESEKGYNATHISNRINEKNTELQVNEKVDIERNQSS